LLRGNTGSSGGFKKTEMLEFHGGLQLLSIFIFPPGQTHLKFMSFQIQHAETGKN